MTFAGDPEPDATNHWVYERGTSFEVHGDEHETTAMQVMSDLANATRAAHRLLERDDVGHAERAVLARFLRLANEVGLVDGALADPRSDAGLAASDRDAAQFDRKLAALDRAAAASDRVRAQRDREEATRDDLTGALRRRPGLAALERELARCRRDNDRFVLGFVDVDGLKLTNDTFGHAAGDGLLCQVVDVLHEHTRAPDLVVRLGGDEFLFAILGSGADAVVDQIADKLTHLDGPDGDASASIGFAELHPNDTLADVIERADRSLLRCRAIDRSATPPPRAAPDRHRGLPGA